MVHLKHNKIYITINHQALKATFRVGILDQLGINGRRITFQGASRLMKQLLKIYNQELIYLLITLKVLHIEYSWQASSRNSLIEFQMASLLRIITFWTWLDKELRNQVSIKTFIRRSRLSITKTYPWTWLWARQLIKGSQIARSTIKLLLKRGLSTILNKWRLSKVFL